MAAPEFYRQDRDLIVATTGELEKVESELAGIYERWETLEGIREGQS